jgi:hypothetical protein
MAERKDPENIFETVGAIWATIVFVPLFVVIIIAGIIEAISPALPFVALAATVSGAAYAYYRYENSPLTIRRRHEQEVLDLLTRAEEQQRALPRAIDDELIRSQLRRRDQFLDHPSTFAFLAPAQALYAEDFLRMLPPMPPVPLEPERVYDIDYDRRTLKKGEEPPYRERRDGKGRPTTLDLEEFKKFLFRYVSSTTDPIRTVSLFAETYADFVAVLSSHLPPVAPSPSPPLNVPLIDFLPSAGAVVTEAASVFWRPEVREKHHFSTVRHAFNRNRQKVSESLLRERDVAEGKVVNPEKHPGSNRDVLDAYLAGTELHPLFLMPVPFALPPAKRFEGHWIVARQGSGKTNALECLIEADLQEVIAGRASVVVIDSQGTTDDTLLGRLSTQKLFAPGQPLDGKLIYLEPDLDFPLALNIFDIGLTDMGRLTASQREDIVSSACEVVEFLFTGLLGGELSDNMTMLYKYLVPAMLVIPDADMNTFIELLDTDTTRERPIPRGYQKYRPYFTVLEPEILSFLETDYLRDFELVKTKAAVRRRLRAAMADTTFRRMFMQPRNKLNLFRELQTGKVILVNTFAARSYVEQFGRLILALIMQATRQRLAIDRSHRMPTYVYVDECQDYIANEERIAKYIDKCRKQNVALIFANQRLANIENPKVRNALSGMAIKFAGTSDADDADLAALTLTTADHVRQLPKGTFAAYVSGLTPRGIDVKFPLSPFEKAPCMTRREWEDMRWTMRDKYAVHHGASQHQPSQPEAEFYERRPNTDDGRTIEGTATRLAIEPPRRPPPDDYDPLK